MITVAGIDCGTNSIRLMIASMDNDGLHVIVPRIMRVVRLGEGVDVHHAFSSAALSRVYEAIDEFAEIIDHHHVDYVRFVATSATRDAKNRHEFESYIYERLGIYPDVISGEEEARLSFLGATSVLDMNKFEAPYLVVDLGGGSTELVLGDAQNPSQIEAAYSMNIGSVRMSERYHLEDAPQEDAISAAIEDIDGNITRAATTVPLHKVRTIIGVSGTVTTMSAIAIGQTEYHQESIDGTIIEIDDVDAVNNRVVRMSRVERDTLSVVHPGRRDVIGAGALVWSRVLKNISDCVEADGGHITSYVASEHGLLDGIVLDLATRKYAEISA
ncbi:Ppx/GppA family phosphatase [Alloscardovia theropitheci]|uniref:Ppx/GppA family phosphatase n=1 Tax=Alloscardovia theropitheci TaxID=2496842 RepID=A0A4R0QMX5_9BIFI|nr:Ppx/GppA phosphatase family protein [Alloscardovia theropitheci]TCD53523.1 Ppx/GppA family phosphatase [Alloscardovia theropitheci]